MIVYKFGGASVNSADAVRNMAGIIGRCSHRPLVIVVSAMGKTTNALERLVPGVAMAEEREIVMAELQAYHYGIINKLFPQEEATGTAYRSMLQRVDALFAQLSRRIALPPTSYNYDYDAVVSFGELISTTIVSGYLNHCGIANDWIDVRKLIYTDDNYREGHVDWPQSLAAVAKSPINRASVVVTQGFIAGTSEGETTTLGREGSDYSAAILSYCLHAESMTIWKDVPGFLNADPKYFPDTVKIDQLPYNEAIELSYYGASVIHPKTVKPLQNKGIPLYIKSFLTPEDEGSTVGPYETISPETPLYIVRHNQVLVSIAPRDFSFIAEDNLQRLFGIFAQVGVRINIMQNSALSFSVCIDHNPPLLKALSSLLQDQFVMRYNTSIQLLTVRYYTPAVIDRIVAGRTILLEQRSRTTAQLVVSER